MSERTIVTLTINGKSKEELVEGFSKLLKMKNKLKDAGSTEVEDMSELHALSESSGIPVDILITLITSVERIEIL